jgi:anti-anti-sigma regulatory factor
MTDFFLEREGSSVKVVVGSQISAAVVSDLRELLCAAQGDGVKDLVLDFSQTTIIDAAGIHLLLAAHNSFSGEQRSLKLVQVPRNILSLLETLRLGERLKPQIG